MLALHADWSVDPRKRWMALARPASFGGWIAQAPRPVGPVATLAARLIAAAAKQPVAFGIDCPIGLPQTYAAQLSGYRSFPDFLARLPDGFLTVAPTLDTVSLARPFYPMHGVAGMTRAAHAAALGLPGPAALLRVCD